MLFHSFSTSRTSRIFLHDAKLHQLFITQQTFTASEQKITSAGWLYPEDETTAKQSHESIWPTDFKDRLQNKSNPVRISNRIFTRISSHICQGLLKTRMQRWDNGLVILGSMLISGLSNIEASMQNQRRWIGKNWECLQKISSTGMPAQNEKKEVRWSCRLCWKAEKNRPEKQRLPFLYRSLAKNFKSRRKPEPTHEWWIG